MRTIALRWPLPALLAWGACWLVFLGLRATPLPAAAGFVAATLVGASLAVFGSTPWRRVFMGAGFPVSLLAGGSAASWPAWVWLAPLAALAFLYPARTWRDAPLFPTPDGALDAVGRRIRLAPGARVLDAGCGLGAGLAALRRAFPTAVLVGIEWSRPLAALCGWRCRRSALDATVRRGDMWAADWSSYTLVYLFQRPESMPRAVAKAARELKHGAWMASLEFEAAGIVPEHVVELDGGRPVWLYRAPFRQAAGASR